MRTIFIVWSIIILMALGVWFGGRCVFDERTQLVLYENHGVISSGEKLGIVVGEPRVDADAAVRRLFTPGYVTWTTGRETNLGGEGRQFSNAPILDGQAEVAYRDRTWRNGVIVLELQDGVVTRMSWHYAGPFYVDL